jgi:hypothetical protein
MLLAAPLFMFAALADDDTVYNWLYTSTENVNSGETWYNRSQLVKDTGLEIYEDASFYLSEDGNTIKIMYTVDDETVTELHQRDEEPAYFSYISVVPEFVGPIPYSSEGLEDGDYWFDLVTFAEDTGMSAEDHETFLTSIQLYISTDRSIFRLVEYNKYMMDIHADNSEEFDYYTSYLYCIGVDPNEGFLLLPATDEGLRFGDYWFDAAGFAAFEEDEVMMDALYYISEDGNTLRLQIGAMKINFAVDDEENANIIAFLHRVGEDPEKAYLDVNVPAGPVYTGETVEVTVDLMQNPGLAAMALSLSYDADVLTLTNVQTAGMTAEGNVTLGGDLTVQPYNILWDDGTAHEDHTETGTILTLTFTVKDSAEAGETPIELYYDAESTFDVDLQNVSLAISRPLLQIVKHLPGDVDCDGEVDLADVTTLSRYLADGWDVTADERNSDVNGDGVLDLKDVVLIRRFLAGGWNVELV